MKRATSAVLPGADKHGATGDEPREVIRRRLRRLRGDLARCVRGQDGAGQIAIHQRHANDKPLLKQDRPRQEQHHSPRRLREVDERLPPR